MKTAVFHRIGEPTEDKFTHSVEQILAYEGTPTFDGVYTSVWDNWPQIKGRLPILFITGDQIGREGYLNRSQLEELQIRGYQVGWHGWSHRRVIELSDEELWHELSKPSWVDPVYAYPHGAFDARAISVLKTQGYKKAYSTTQGEEGNDFAIPREYV